MLQNPESIWAFPRKAKVRASLPKTACKPRHVKTACIGRTCEVKFTGPNARCAVAKPWLSCSSPCVGWLTCPRLHRVVLDWRRSLCGQRVHQAARTAAQTGKRLCGLRSLSAQARPQRFDIGRHGFCATHLTQSAHSKSAKALNKPAVYAPVHLQIGEMSCRIYLVGSWVCP